MLFNYWLKSTETEGRKTNKYAAAGFQGRELTIWFGLLGQLKKEVKQWQTTIISETVVQHFCKPYILNLLCTYNPYISNPLWRDTERKWWAVRSKYSWKLHYRRKWTDNNPTLQWMVLQAGSDSFFVCVSRIERPIAIPTDRIGLIFWKVWVELTKLPPASSGFWKHHIVFLTGKPAYLRAWS